MAKDSEEFLRKLLATFQLEAEEHLRTLSANLVKLEKCDTREQQAEVIEAAFREAHSLKGAARAVNNVKIESLCQTLESMFAALRSKSIASSPGLLDPFHEVVDALMAVIFGDPGKPDSPPASAVAALARADDKLPGDIPPAAGRERRKQKLSKQNNVAATEASQQEMIPRKVEVAAAFTETVRISATKLNNIMLEAEEFIGMRLRTAQRATELRAMNVVLEGWERKWNKLRPEIRMIERMASGASNHDNPTAKLLSFLDWNSRTIGALVQESSTLAKQADQDHRTIASLTQVLLDDMKKVLMLPFATLLEGFPKLVRDLSRDRGKEVKLIIHGGELEIDRRILEEIKDPLIHLVRNCIDHGLETPVERSRKKKVSQGTITIAISQKDGDKVELLVSDDGSGIDVSEVLKTAVRTGTISKEQAAKLDESEAHSLIFHSGISTSPIITDLSGRGLGLAIVREKVENLGGTVSVESTSGIGSMFRITLPLTLARFRGVLVRVGEQLFVLPLRHVERVVRITAHDVETVENRETILYSGQPVSLVWLRDALDLPDKSDRREIDGSVHVAILVSREKKVAFLVDEVLEEQEVLLKNLGPHLSRVRNFAGAAVLGTNRVVPVINVTDLLESSLRPHTASAAASDVEKPRTDGKAILIAEDSITARSLLKNIVESAGYRVRTAVDGADAFATLRTEDFDLVVSDVDMPRMSGFDLTARIRGDKKLANIPVILVTALESREDREHGIDVGANAYIVKSSFDQSNLLEVIRRLI